MDESTLDLGAEMLLFNRAMATAWVGGWVWLRSRDALGKWVRCEMNKNLKRERQTAWRVRPQITAESGSMWWC